MKSKIFLLVFVFFLIFSPKVSKAQVDFIIDVVVDYDISEKGITTVTHTVSIENAITNLYATSYSLGLSAIKPINPRAYKNSRALELSEKIVGENISLEVAFEDTVVGIGNSQTFSIVFEEESFATKTGEVWEVSIPRLANKESFRTYKVNLLVPVTFGEKAFISPEPKSKGARAEKTIFSFEKEGVATSGISAGFGEFQIFTFSLSYHLENPLSRKAKTEIAIPPDSSFQKVYYQSIDPAPIQVHIDSDGNWLAEYELDARERIDISAVGTVQIFSEPREFPKPTISTLEKNKLESEFWQTYNTEISDLANILGTPSKIYDYVSQNLSYNYERVRPNVERLGALEALKNPKNAICMEYTDLFIALARAGGIPAREVNGFAYSENPDLQPLSLVADVLHAWPEYWDEERQAWIPVDPTWGSTTGGVDFFNKLDLRHFAFVFHGSSPRQPYPPGSYKLGPNPQKDVFVNFGQLPERKLSKPQIVAETKTNIPFNGMEMVVKIVNNGPLALYDLEPKIYYDENLAYSNSIKLLPPYASFETTAIVPFSFMGRKTPESVEILVADEKITIPSFKAQVIIYNLVALFVAILAVSTVIFIKIRKKNAKLLPFLAKNKNSLLRNARAENKKGNTFKEGN